MVRLRTNSALPMRVLPRRFVSVSFVVILILLLTLRNTSANDGGKFSGDYSKLSGIIIPGFASTQLRAWSILDCPYSPLDFNPLDLVWLDTTKVIFHHYNCSVHSFVVCIVLSNCVYHMVCLRIATLCCLFIFIRTLV